MMNLAGGRVEQSRALARSRCFVSAYSISPLSIYSGTRCVVRWTVPLRTAQPSPNPRQTGAGSVSYEWYGNNSGCGHSPTTVTLIEYARCSTDRQDLDGRLPPLMVLGVAPDRIYTDHGLTGARPGLGQAIAAVCQCGTLVVPKLDRPPGHSRTPALSSTGFGNVA